MSMTTVMENVTSSTNATSRDKEVLIERLVELAIVRYAFPVVVAVGNVAVVVYDDCYLVKTTTTVHSWEIHTCKPRRGLLSRLAC